MAQVFKNKKVNVESEIFVIPGVALIEVLISGVLDGADVRTLLLNSDNSITVLRNLSVRTSEGESLPAPPLGDGGIETILTSRVMFDIINAGASTDISLSFKYKTIK